MQKMKRTKKTAGKAVVIPNGRSVSVRTLRTVRGASRAIVRTHKEALIELGDK